MDFGQMGPVDQHRSSALLGTTVALCILASRHTGHGSEHELVLDDVWRRAYHRHVVLLLQGSTYLRGTCCLRQTRSLKTLYDDAFGVCTTSVRTVKDLTPTPLDRFPTYSKKNPYLSFIDRSRYIWE